jgi:hypothetical protein
MSLNILEWTEAYLKYKDTVHRKIQRIEQKPGTNQIVCENKDGTTHTYICVEDLSSLSPKELNDKRVSCLNTKKNADWLINNWSEVKNTNVTFLFANPKKATHWSINPRLHDSISDKSAVKPGIKALFESIPEV